MKMFQELRSGVRESLGWLNRRRSLVAMVQTARELIPGDSDFGDPMSTSGLSPTHALGRRAWLLQNGRFTLLAELTLAALQLADWLGEDIRGVASGEKQAILFVDLRGFSQWALTAETDEVANLLRRVDAVVTEMVEAHDGVLVKRLGDGAMAIFADCEPAVEAAFDAIAEVGQIRVGGYEPILRGGVHVGTPYRIGRDYVGVDVNISARLCEAAPGGGVLVSGEVQNGLTDRWPATPAPGIQLRGVPEHVSIHLARPPQPNGNSRSRSDGTRTSDPEHADDIRNASKAKQ